MTPKWHIPRRTVLRGMGTAVALPFLEAMVLPRRGSAALTATPRRFVGSWALPTGAVGKWDPVQNSMVSPWTPDQQGPIPAPDAAGFLSPFFGEGQPLGTRLAGC